MLWALILYVSGQTYSLMSTTSNWFLRNFSWQVYLLSELRQKSAEKKSQKKSPKEYFFFIFRCDPWPGILTRALRLIRNLLRRNRRRNFFFHVSLWWLTWDINPGFTSNNPKILHTSLRRLIQVSGDNQLNYVTE